MFLPPHWSTGPAGEGQYWEKRILAAPISVLRQNPAPAGSDRVALRKAHDIDFYPKYRLAFEALVEDFPRYREYTRLEQGGDLSELVDAGTLFEIEVDGQ